MGRRRKRNGEEDQEGRRELKRRRRRREVARKEEYSKETDKVSYFLWCSAQTQMFTYINEAL